jgi:hypothetical protein
VANRASSSSPLSSLPLPLLMVLQQQNFLLKVWSIYAEDLSKEFIIITFAKLQYYSSLLYHRIISFVSAKNARMALFVCYMAGF